MIRSAGERSGSSSSAIFLPGTARDARSGPLRESRVAGPQRLDERCSREPHEAARGPERSHGERPGAGRAAAQVAGTAAEPLQLRPVSLRTMAGCGPRRGDVSPLCFPAFPVHGKPFLKSTILSPSDDCQLRSFSSQVLPTLPSLPDRATPGSSEKHGMETWVRL